MSSLFSQSYDFILILLSFGFSFPKHFALVSTKSPLAHTIFILLMEEYDIRKGEIRK